MTSQAHKSITQYYQSYLMALLVAIATGFSVLAMSVADVDIDHHYSFASNHDVEISAPFDAKSVPLVLIQSAAASHFTHAKQQATWFDVEPSYLTQFFTDSGYFEQSSPPIVLWFITSLASKHRLGGWKDSNLIYRFINALV